MTKHIEAFFKTENDAESAKAELQKLSISNQFVEPIPEESRLTGIVPVLNQGTTAGVAGFRDFIKPNKSTSEDDTPPDTGHLTHLLHFDVDKDDYNDALAILKTHDGHMDKDKI
ncbi:hypothetical protein GCM10010954_22720 [Halobacillus andaensis]|uniref:Uncharacterized protein n=1 Tax=Halobacillus andaensis TaxID=1176239 RepID=A0A917B5G0_HALAA|nr:hypothetical protein [Halobacillus andaensis]MBP2006139.1 hypothetical protein [Halobacillus andaensis]GGF23364.1 hypothetical protein GCM10010954_22720 [Halobacillus andaensis]